jgi:hypothetical protein
VKYNRTGKMPVPYMPTRGSQSTAYRSSARSSPTRLILGNYQPSLVIPVAALPACHGEDGDLLVARGLPALSQTGAGPVKCKPSTYQAGT